MQSRPQPLPEPHLYPFTEALAMAEAAKSSLALLTGFDLLADGAGVELDSHTWAENFFQPAASPWFEGCKAERLFAKGGAAHHDVLVHRYTLGDDLQIDVTESVKSLLVRVGLLSGDLLEGGDTTAAGRIAALADRVLLRAGEADFLGESRPYRWVFQYQPPLAEGSRFSTAPDLFSPMFQTWADRVDGGIDRGQVVFFCTKHRSSGDGQMVSLRGRGWFDGSCWDPYEDRKRPRR
jgi:hypothetical protein